MDEKIALSELIESVGTRCSDHCTLDVYETSCGEIDCKRREISRCYKNCLRYVGMPFLYGEFEHLETSTSTSP